MTIDVNAQIGHYPFRKTRHKTAADMIGLMDRYNIDISCAASLNAIFYKDCMEGNYELLDGIGPYKGRFIPFCVINPEYNSAQDDFLMCVKKLGFKGLRLFPRQHGYKLDGGEAAGMMRMAGEMGIPVHIPILLEDLRGHHPLDIAVPIDAEEIKRAALLSPHTDIILSNDYFQYFAEVIEPACGGRAGKVYYDISRVDCVFLTSLGELIDIVGYDRVLFGTGSMLQNIAVQFVKLHYMGGILGASQEQVECIKSKNLAGLLKL